MNKLRLKAKLLTLVAVFLIPIACLSWLNVREINADIVVTESEIQGTQYIRLVRQWIELAQKHRGLASGYLSGNIANAEKLDKNEQAVAALMPKLIAMDKLYAALNLADNLKLVQTDWNDLVKQTRTLNSATSFGEHTKLINSLQGYAQKIQDTSTLTLDPQEDTYYLIDSAYFRALPIIETMAQLRGLGNGVLTRKALTTEERVLIASKNVELSKIKMFTHTMKKCLRNTVTYLVR